MTREEFDESQAKVRREVATALLQTIISLKHCRSSKEAIEQALVLTDDFLKELAK